MGRRKYTRKKVHKVVTEPEPVEPLKLENFRVRGNSSEANITNVIPQVWGEILQHLSPKDFLSLINSSPLLRNQLQDEKEKILLPMILPILVTGRFITNRQAFLELRKLYPVTKQAIDALLEEEYSPEKCWQTITTRDLEWTEWVGDENLKLKRICQNVQQKYDKRFQRKIQRHLEQEEQQQPNNLVTNFNPFLARYFHVELNDILAENRVSLLNFMCKYGHHIVHLSCSELRDIHFVFLLLPHLRNLKVLKLYSKEDVQRQDEYVRQVHYPDLPQLELLDFEGFYDNETMHANTRMYAAFVKKYGPQLKALNCNDHFFRGWWALPLRSFFFRQLCNLQRLRVAHVRDQTLPALSEANLPALQEIHFSQAIDTPPRDQLKLQQVLDVLNRFDQTLTCFQFYVRMETNRCRFESLKEGSMIPLPNLTRFGTYIFNLDFDWFQPFIQLKCPNLVELNLQRTNFSGRAAKEKHNHKRIQKIVFQLAPKLKKITITYRSGFSWNPNLNAERIVITRGSIRSKILWKLKN